MPLSNKRKRELDLNFWTEGELTPDEKAYLNAKYRRTRNAKGQFEKSIKFKGQPLPKKFQNAVRDWAQKTDMTESIKKRILEGEDLENIFPNMPIDELSKNMGLSKKFFAFQNETDKLTKNEFQVMPELATHLKQFKDDETENLIEIVDEDGFSYFDEEALEYLEQWEKEKKDEKEQKLREWEKVNDKKRSKKPTFYPIQHEISFDAVKNKYFLDLGESEILIG